MAYRTALNSNLKGRANPWLRCTATSRPCPANQDASRYGADRHLTGMAPAPEAAARGAGAGTGTAAADAAGRAAGTLAAPGTWAAPVNGTLAAGALMEGRSRMLSVAGRARSFEK